MFEAALTWDEHGIVLNGGARARTDPGASWQRPGPLTVLIRWHALAEIERLPFGAVRLHFHERGYADSRYVLRFPQAAFTRHVDGLCEAARERAPQAEVLVAESKHGLGLAPNILDWSKLLVTLFGAGNALRIEIPWHDLTRFEPAEHWPDATIAWSDAGGPQSRRLSEFYDRSGYRYGDTRERVGRTVEAFSEALRKNRPGVLVQTGWLAREEVAFEPVDDLPADDPPTGEGAYRASGRAREPVLLRTGPTAWQRAFAPSLRWIARLQERGREDLPTFRLAPVETALTTENLYARTASGRAYRVPLAALTGHEQGPADHTFTFGRRATLVLTDPPEGALISHLRSEDVGHRQGDLHSGDRLPPHKRS